MGELHRQNQQRSTGAVGCDAITALDRGQPALVGWNEVGRHGRRLEHHRRIRPYFLHIRNRALVTVRDNDLGGAPIAQVRILDLVQAKGRPRRARLGQDLGNRRITQRSVDTI